MRILSLILLIAFAATTGCKHQRPPGVPMFAKDTTNERERNNKLVVFIGEKISLREKNSSDSTYEYRSKAKYRVLDLIYGNYKEPTIEFEVYDGSESPIFSDNKYVMLYVSQRENGTWHQEGYMCDGVYKTKDGRWAGMTYNYFYNDTSSIKLVPMQFEGEVSFPIITDEYYDRSDFFRAPYFKMVGNKAIALYGSYVEDLFRFQRDGILTDMGLFGIEKPREDIIVPDVALEEVKDEPTKKKKEPDYSELDAYFDSLISSKAVPGIAVTISIKHNSGYRKTFGTSNANDTAELTPSHNFHAASISKTFTATAIMRLAEQRRLDINKALVTYLPYFKMADDRYKKITIKQMLNHTSGMPDVEDYEWEKAVSDEGALERYVRSLTNEKLISDPGKEFHYSNMAYDILGDVVAKVSGVSFERYVDVSIFRNLYMLNSSFLYSEIHKLLRTSPHAGHPFQVSKIYPYNRMHAPSSTLNTNIIELSYWGHANLDDDRGIRGVISQETHKLMTTPTFKINENASMGLSWFITQYKGVAIREHGGGDLGYRSMLTLLPEKNIVIAILCNHEDLNLYPVRNRIIDVLMAQGLVGK